MLQVRDGAQEKSAILDLSSSRPLVNQSIDRILYQEADRPPLLIRRDVHQDSATRSGVSALTASTGAPRFTKGAKPTQDTKPI